VRTVRNVDRRAAGHTSATVIGVEADDLRSQSAPIDAAGDRLIADRLDALEAEKVMQRALELEAESLGEQHMISTEQLGRIAKEIGVDPAFVQQALGEVRLNPADRGWFARTVLPAPLVETASLQGLTRSDVDASIDKWMTQNEGFMRGAVTPGGAEWDIDKRWTAKLRSSTLSGANRISRVAGSDVAHRVHSSSEQDHLVAFESQGKGPLRSAGALMALGIALGALSAAGVSDVLAGIGLFAAWTVAGVGVGIVGARWWAQGIRGALRRSLTGLVGAAKPQRKGWLARRRDRKARAPGTP